MARLTPFHLLPALIAAVSHAGELTIETRPFTVERSFPATALPGGDCTLLKISPKAWADFEVSQIAEHGSTVTKGEVLIRFDVLEIDKKLTDARRAIASGQLALAQAEQDAKLLQETAPHKLEAARRAAEMAKQDNAYFTLTRRKAEEESASQSLKRREQLLSGQREELRQLKKMYEADDVTEDTEEIILVRQQDSVASAEFALRMEALDHKLTLEVSLPREAKTLADAERDSAISLKKLEADLPRSLESSKLALEALRTAHERAKQDLADLEADRLQFEFKAPADGTFYHGPIENGRWAPGDAAKSLIPHGQVAVHKAFATFVPGAARLSLIAFLEESSARALKPDSSGTATLAGLEEVEIPVKITQLATIPAADGSYRADLSATWPAGLAPAAGSTATVRFISYQQPSAIAIPSKALDHGAAGWTVEVKLADGKTEHRPIKRGHVSSDHTEILSGLEVGQVILVP